MGNEQAGLPVAYTAQCDALVKMPMKGTADSLNVAVATAVLLYEALGQLEPPA
jgi:TrmH family RNA methyltransferase